MEFMKGIVLLVKVDEMYNILKSASRCLLAERLDKNGWSKLILQYSWHWNKLIWRSKKIEKDEKSNF